MPRNDSSPQKPIEKADSPNRSTTSSTTGSTRKRGGRNQPNTAETAARPKADVDVDFSEDAAKPQAAEDAATTTAILPVASPPRRLSRAQQERYLELLVRGGSTAAACAHVGVSAIDVQDTIDNDDVFRERHAQVHMLLSQNVAAALYRSAMEGNVSAQTSFLKNQPPPHWKDGEASAAENSPYDHMSDDEFLAFCRASGIDWPSEDPTATDPPAVAD